MSAVVASAAAALAVVLATRPPRSGALRTEAGTSTAGPPGGPPRDQVGQGAGSRDAGPALVGIGVALAVGLVAPGWLALVALPAGALAWRRAGRWETRAQRRHRRQVEDELPHVVDLVRALVFSGAAPDRALVAVSQVVSTATRVELGASVGRLRLGSDPVEVWAELSRHPELGRLGTALRRATVSGAPVTEALLRLSDDLRSARRADVQRRVREVETKAAAPLGACLLPAFLLLGVVPLVAGVMRDLVLQ